MVNYILKSDPYGAQKKSFRSELVSDNVDFLNDKLFLEFGVMDGNSILDFYNSYFQSFQKIFLNTLLHLPNHSYFYTSL